MSTRRAVFARVGNFQTGIGRLGKIPIGCEETEFCIRAYQQWPNGRFLYEPNARVYQHVPPARARWQYFQTRCYAEGISKAQVVKYVGSNDGLSSEWRYTFFVLPRGVVRGVIYAIAGDLHGLGRAAAIVAGLAITTYGYLVGTLQAKVAAWKEWLSQYNQSSRQTKASYVQKGG
jgi:hypothetical protein